MPNNPPTQVDKAKPEWMNPPSLRDHVEAVLETFKRRGWIGFPVFLIGIAAGLVVGMYQREIYSARMIIQIRPQPTESVPALMMQQRDILQSENVSGKVQKNTRDEFDRGVIPDVPKWDVKLTPADPILILSARSRSAQNAVSFLGSLSKAFLREVQSGVDPAETGEIARLRQEINKLENEEQKNSKNLKKIEAENNLEELKNLIATTPLSIRELQKRLETIRISLDSINRRKTLTPPDLVDPAQSSSSVSIAKKLFQAPKPVSIRSDEDPKEELKIQKAERDVLSQILSDSHPEVSRLDEDIKQKETIISKAEKAADLIDPLRDPLFKEELAIEKNISDLEVKFKAAMKILGEHDALSEEVERNKALKTNLTEQYDKLGGKAFSRAIIKQEPVVGGETIKPNRVLFISYGAVGGGALALLVIFILEFADDRPRTARELYRKCGQTILGVVPMVGGRKPDAGPLLFNELRENHPFALSFRKIRDEMIQSAADKPLKTILVTSSVPADGKSTNSVNLAIAFSEKGKTVLLDSDLRRMNIHRYFKMTNGPGVLDILSGRCKPEECTQATSVPKLDLLRAGSIPEHPGEMFLANKFKALLETLGKTYDYIIVDSAPVMVADDTLSLAPNADGVIFIVRANQTPFRIVQRALAFLMQRRAKLVGIIFNSSKSVA